MVDLEMENISRQGRRTLFRLLNNSVMKPDDTDPDVFCQKCIKYATNLVFRTKQSQRSA